MDIPLVPDVPLLNTELSSYIRLLYPDLYVIYAYMYLADHNLC